MHATHYGIDRPGTQALAATNDWLERVQAGESIVNLTRLAKQLDVRPLTVRRWWAGGKWPVPTLYNGRNCWLAADLSVPLAEMGKVKRPNLERLDAGRPAKGTKAPRNEAGELRLVVSEAMSAAGAGQVARVIERFAADGKPDSIPEHARRGAIQAFRRLVAMHRGIN